MELYRGSADIIFQSTPLFFTWQHPEYLSINGGEYFGNFDGEEAYDEIKPDVPDFLEGLVKWLQLRQKVCQSDLRIKLSSFNGDANWISKMHDALYGLCVLEWVDSTFNMSVGLSGTSTTPSLVRDFLDILLISGLMPCRTCHLYLLAAQPVSAGHF